MSFLLDTNVLSEARKPACDPEVRRWLSTTPLDQQFVSVLTIGEIGRGITRLRRRGDDQQASVYRRWLESIVAVFERRIIPISLDVATTWAELDPGLSPPAVDALIGSTARSHGWTLVTRNVKDFQHIGVPLINPFTDEEAP